MYLYARDEDQRRRGTTSMIAEALREPMPSVHFARGSDGTNLAYWSQGSGGTPLLVLGGLPFGHLALEWDITLARRFFTWIAARRRVVRFDWRGAGMSTRQPRDQSLEAYTSDIESVVAEAGLEKFAILGNGLGCMVALQYAAEHPQSVSHLLLLHPVQSGAEFVLNPRVAALISLARENWAVFAESMTLAHVGWSDAEAGVRCAEMVRSGISQPFYLDFIDALRAYDVSALLPGISAPALVLHRLRSSRDQAISTTITQALPLARLVLLEGRSNLLYDESFDVLPYLEGFLSGESVHPFGSLQGALPASGGHSLTPRELEILRLLAQGLSNKEIGLKLGLSSLTIQRHVANLYEKIEVHNRAAATAFALRHGLA